MSLRREVPLRKRIVDPIYVALSWAIVLSMIVLAAIIAGCARHGGACPPVPSVQLPQPSKTDQTEPKSCQPPRTSWAVLYGMVSATGHGFSRRSDGEARALAREDASATMDQECVGNGYLGVYLTSCDDSAIECKKGDGVWECAVDCHGWCKSKDDEG